MGVSENTIQYHLNPEYRKKAIERAFKSYFKLSKKERKEKEKKSQKYKSAYNKKRYHEDENFRKRMISQIRAYQKRQKLQKNDNKKR